MIMCSLVGVKFENSKFDFSANTEWNELYLAGYHRLVGHSQCEKFKANQRWLVKSLDGLA